MCVIKKVLGDMYGSCQKLWDMIYFYKEIEDFVKIFNVEDCGQVVIVSFKKCEVDLCKEFGKSKKDFFFVFWFLSVFFFVDVYVGGKNSVLGFIVDVLGGYNVIIVEVEWLIVGWESIIVVNLDVIVVLSFDCNCWVLDNVEEKIKFLKSDLVVSQFDVVKKGYIVVMDGQVMNLMICIIYGVEQVGEQFRKLGLN